MVTDVRSERRSRNMHPVRTLDEVAQIMFERGKAPCPWTQFGVSQEAWEAENFASPSKNLVAYYEARAFEKMRRADPELENLLDDCDSVDDGGLFEAVTGAEIVERW
jgi:hypothetical protein